MPMAGGPVGGGPMPMMANNALVAGQGQRAPVPENNRANLNTYIYDYFIREGMYECARALLNSEQALNVHKNSPRRDENGVGDDPMDTDSKDDVDQKRPSDLPAPNVPDGGDQCFLYEWFCLFWDMLSAQRNKGGVSPNVSQYVAHTQQQSRMQRSHQNDLLRQGMYPNAMMARMPNGMPMNKQGNTSLARAAMANNQNNPQMQMLQATTKNQMQRDGSNMDSSQNRPASPGSTDNAPSPSKRPRLDGAGPFNPQQHPNMMNGQRPQQGMPGGPGVGDTSKAYSAATQMLRSNGIDPTNLSAEQFRDFQAQPAQNQAKSIQTYAVTLQQHHGQQMPNKQIANPNGPQGQGSPMLAQGPDSSTLNAFYNADIAPGGMRPGPGANASGGSSHALQDYQMQLMLLEQQNKKRLMMARQEQDNGVGGMPRADGAPNGQGGPVPPPGQGFQDASPQGVRPGASPNPSEQMKRGTPQMGPAGIPSPLPEGAQSRGSPNTMNFMANGNMDPNMQKAFFNGVNGMDSNMIAAQMNGGMRPPSSHPGAQFNGGQMNPQMMRQGGPQGGPQQMQWQGGPNTNGMAPGPPGAQGPPQGTPQQRAMPPPSAPAAGANANGRNTSSPQTSNAAPPTPNPPSKANPKKKDNKNAKTKAAANKKSQATGATPAAEANQEPEPPTPATPITPVNPVNFKPGQNGGAQPPANAPASAPQAAPAPIAAPPADQSSFSDMTMGDPGSMFNIEFAPLGNENVLNDFDFDSFLHDNDGGAGDFDFNPASFGMEPTGEIGTE
ncbi:hypothetical protein F5Y16DRAFT_422160 [Xylariaceae sp. FL0255]|nr:hypothetical protein F5Y16DRAFT_422160 [Xylariaceae sp. FL0255]